MKKIFLLLAIVLSSTCVLGQSSGSLLIKCIERSSLQPIKGMTVEISQDSICSKGITNEKGSIRFEELKAGSAFLEFSLENQIEEREVFIQSKQLLQYTVVFDSSSLELQDLKAKDFVESNQGRKNGGLSFDRNRQFSQNIMNTANTSMQEIEEVMVVAYKSPLINKDNGAQSQVIVREDISRMPVRSANGIAATVGGVNGNEVNTELNFRGARNGANTYYIDGMKVLGRAQLPKSYIGEVTVYNGSIPANYGDVTGGVVSITSKPIKMTKVTNSSSSSSKSSSCYDFERRAALNYDEFLPIYENDFLSPLNHPNSTFGLDVDQAAWEYLKYIVKSGRSIQRDAVKLEEMINAFQYKDVTVPEEELFNVEFTRSACSWNESHELVSVHLKTKDFPENSIRKPHNFVFLIDVSGSMNSRNRLPLIVDGLKTFVASLRKEDRISIVTYSGYSGVVLESTRCENKKKILNALSSLESGGSTNGIGGIKEAYSQAEASFDTIYNNRIILATDGDFNVGINSPGDLENYIAEKRGKGIYLTALGVGMGNYKNSTLETLAKKGDGNHFYIRSLKDIDRVLNNIGNLISIARDVKLNVEFNPRLISNYRLIGYENRLLKPKDFDDDQKDGGELGYGHSLTAVFEVEKGKASTLENHFVKQRSKFGKKNLAHVKLRYKPFEDSASVQRVYDMLESQPKEENELLSLVIALGLELRDSAFKGDLTKETLINQVNNFKARAREEKELKKIILEIFL